MKKQSLRALVTLLIVCTCCSAVYAADYIETMRQAEELEKRGDLVGATKLFIQATKEGADSPISGGYAQANLGNFYARHGQYDYAERCLLYAIDLDRKALADDRKSTAALAKRAQERPASTNPLFKQFEDRSHEAIKRLAVLSAERAKDQPFGDEPEHVSDLAMVYYLRNNKPKAEELWIKAIKMDPGMRTSLEALADRTNWEKRNPEKSVTLWKEALAIRKKAIPAPHERLASGYGYMGNVLFHNLHKTKEAESAYKNSISNWKAVAIDSEIKAWSKRSMLECYAKLLDRTDRYNEAAKVRVEVEALKRQEAHFKAAEARSRRG